MFDLYYDRLNEQDRDRFKECVKHLISKSFVLREEYSVTKSIMLDNPMYRFIELHSDVIGCYLDYMGWKINIDRKYGVVHAYDDSDRAVDRFSINESMFLIILRLIYDEKRESLQRSKDVLTTTKEIIDKLLSTSAVKRKPSDQDMKDALRIAQYYNVITKKSGLWTEATCQILIHPTVIFLVSDAIVNGIVERIGELLEDEDEDTKENKSN